MLDEDRLVVNRTKELIYQFENKNNITFLGFLNEHERTVIVNYFSNYYNLNFFGGYPDSERTMVSVENEYKKFPISCIQFIYRDEDILSHRDFLGTILSLGLEREVVGDIIVSIGKTLVFVRSEIAEYIISQVDKVKNCGVNLELIECEDIKVKQNYEISSYIVSSMRLDVIISSICKLSRDKASKLISSELVQLNHCVELSKSKILNNRDVVSVRKYGKFQVLEQQGFTKKGRIKLLIKYFK